MTNGDIFWFTGLSGVGKSTIANAAKLKLELMGFKVLILDGDVVRSKLHWDLGFSKCDIEENNRLISELCVKKKLEYDIILVPIISPYRQSRSKAKNKIGKNFYDIYLFADLETLYDRDTKGLYKQARDGVIDNLIGVSKTSKYEPPDKPDLKIDTKNNSINDSVEIFINFVIKKNSISESLK
jgi:adenylyl-sulfate kinase